VHDNNRIGIFRCVSMIWGWYCKLYNCVVANGRYNIDNFVAYSSNE